MIHNSPKNSGLTRCVKAFFYSLQGLRHAARSEPAFKQELLLTAALSIIALLLPLSPQLKLALVVSHLLILLIELLNSAIEAVVDKASPEFNELAGRAKDMGSAAVLVAFVISGIVWIYALGTL